MNFQHQASVSQPFGANLAVLGKLTAMGASVAKMPLHGSMAAKTLP